MEKVQDRIYRFRVIHNWDDGSLGGAETDLDTFKTKCLICEDTAEDLTDRAGSRYLVSRPQTFWNNQSPHYYTGNTFSPSGSWSGAPNPIHPHYQSGDQIHVTSVFSDTLFNPLDFTVSSNIKSFVTSFNSSSTPLFANNEISASTGKFYFMDINLDGRNRSTHIPANAQSIQMTAESSGGSANMNLDLNDITGMNLQLREVVVCTDENGNSVQKKMKVLATELYDF